MGIRVGAGKIKLDWTKLVSAAAEILARFLLLGDQALSGAIGPYFRIVEGLRGDDDTELRATRLVVETLGYAVTATIAGSQLARNPEKPEAAEIIRTFIDRAKDLMAQQEIILQSEHLEQPASFPIFKDAASQIHYELRLCKPKRSKKDVEAQFRSFVSEGMNRIRTRKPDYFSPIIQALTGPDARSDAQQRAWDEYRARLIRRFEDESLFGEDPEKGVTLGEAYQPLRGWWNSDDDGEAEVPGAPASSAKLAGNIERTIGMLDELVLTWLDKDAGADRVRLISGGPGSGKSTFAKWLAASLASKPRWRVVFVPLQRLKGTGPLETRINEYFRLQTDEPFGAEAPPLASLGRDGHPDWLIIFDGLDELAKEGSGSESAAQDFASALADWRGRIGGVGVRFLVLGRAPSMQEARRRLGLHGAGTLYVADMVPIRFPDSSGAGRKLRIVDPKKVQDIDQRAEFWGRWATAKGLPLAPPEAMKVEALADLTKEPLLAYLLILSGYVSERWPEAADNRNRIYQAIFNQIWDRERTKATRLHLNDLGEEGFDAIMQALGLAAWRGSGRTGDAATFEKVRDAFLPPRLLVKAKECGVGELSSVALLFYTRKDEEGGKGYEFLHKSFGEYLTARGLLNAFQRWGSQAVDDNSDFDEMEFLRRWLKLAGPESMTSEILKFLRNEVRLQASAADPQRSWKPARAWVRIAERVVDAAVKNGLPAHETASNWRNAEKEQINGEIALWTLLDACARVAYPIDLRKALPDHGGWAAGPVEIDAFKTDVAAFSNYLLRTARVGNPAGRSISSSRDDTNTYVATCFHNQILTSCITRLNLVCADMFAMTLINADLEGSNLEAARFAYATLADVSLLGASIAGASMVHCYLVDVDLHETNLHSADFTQAYLDRATLKSASLDDELLQKLARIA